jgi:predicted transposase/invertase (TIGR01784 family)
MEKMTAEEFRELYAEFQTVPDAEMPFRMIDYRIRGYRKFATIPMRQIVIYLVPTTSELVYETSFEIANTQHEFEVIRLWEQPASIFLESPGLYPFASLGQTEEPDGVLRSVAAKIEEIPERNLQADLAATTSILAGLVLDKEQIKRILRRDIMRESVMYQDILAEGKAQGKAEGKAEGEASGLERGRTEEGKSLVLRQLTRKLGNLTPQLHEQVNNLSLDRVESLGEDLLDFTKMEDLENWLT